MRVRNRVLLQVMMFGRVCVFVALIFLSKNALAQVTSDFATDLDGWTGTGFTPGINYSPTDGNPDGHVWSQSPGSITIGAQVVWFWWFFNAPAKFEGNKSAYYNGNLRYDAQQATTGTPIQIAQVVMTNNGGVSLYYYPASAVTPPAPPDWTTFNIHLSADEGYWKTADASTAQAATQAQITSVLTDLAEIQIQGLYQNANVVTRIDNVTMYPPIIIDMQPQSRSACENEVVTFTIAASNNPDITYQWQILDPVVGYIDIQDGGGYLGTTTDELIVNTAAMFGAGTYRAILSGTAVDDALTMDASLFVNARTAPPTATGASSCEAAALTLTAAGGIAEQYRWYTVETGGTAIPSETSETYVTPEIDETTTYYVALADLGQFNCESVRVPVLAHIGPPDPPTAVGAQSCEPATIILTADGGSSGQYRWYTQQSGGGQIPDEDNRTYLTPLISATTTYYVAIDNGECESSRTPVTATIGGSTCGPTTPPVLTIYNAVSPNKDGKNDVFFIENIDVIEAARKNSVRIFNRWGDLVWEASDYNNTTVAFSGLSKNNSELPSGIYYYKIEFTGGGLQNATGYIELKR